MSQAGRVNIIDYTSHTLRQAEKLSDEPGLIEKGLPVAGITSHHLPTAENFIHAFYAKLSKLRPNLKYFLIVGPDHFERCQGLVTTTKKDFLTPFGILENSPDGVRLFEKSGVGVNNDCFANEHSVGVQTAFIKKYFPDAKVNAIIFSSAASSVLPEQLANEFYENFPEAMVVGSIDFSHYQTVKKANFIDSRTEVQIRNLEASSLTLEQLDSPASLRFVLAWGGFQKAQATIVSHANSYDFSGIPDNTTGYFNVIYTK
ncbi:MAG: AmmeMemoRadiSam system protein B [Candidatus Doudnabacteria bacterium]|nr:AmmeMemoRadiSam system protein B [Candidatus Doudnabacteria bacterium]